MEKLKLNNGIEMPQLGFGVFQITDYDLCKQSVKNAFKIGYRLIDTAACYGNEKAVGDAIRESQLTREELFISSKVWIQKDGYEGTKQTFMKSLDNLQTDYIDILYIHRWDYHTPIEETMCALNDLVSSVKVHYLGASSMYAWQFQKAQYVAEKNGWTKFSVMQGHYNLLYREEEREMNPFCLDSGVALVPYSPLAAGRLTRDWDSDSKRFQEDQVAKRKYDITQDSDQIIVERVAQIAQKYNVSRSQVAIAWLWQKGVTAPIVGITKEKYLDDFVGAFQVQLSEDDIKYLEEAYVPHNIVGHQ